MALTVPTMHYGNAHSCNARIQQSLIMNPDRRTVIRALIFLVAVALTVTAYYRGLSGDYIFDDFPNLLQNKQIHIDSLDLDSLKAAAFSSGSGMLRRPVSMTSFALNYYFFGIKPFSFKLVNLVIHLLTGASLFWLASLLLHAFRRIHRPALPDHRIYWTALAASAVWMLHPLNLTGVLFVAQRMASLAALFTVLGLCLYVLGRLRLWEGRPGLSLILSALLVFGLLAVLSKENGALLPLYMFVVEFTVFGFRAHDNRWSKPVIVFFVIVLALPAVGALLWMIIDPERFLYGYAVRSFTPWERLLTEARVLVFYLKLILAPSLGELGLYHDDFMISTSLFKPISTLFAVIALFAALLSSVLWRRKIPILSLAVMWFFAGHILESTILPLEIAFEHRNYLAGFGIMFALVYLLLNGASTGALHRLFPLALVALIAALFTLTWLRAGQWSNNVDQAIHEVRHHPESVRANYGAGRIFAHLVLAGQITDPAPAIRYFEQARSLGDASIAAESALIIFASKIAKELDPSWIEGIKHKLLHQPIAPNTVVSLKQLILCQETQCPITNDQMRSVIDAAFQNPNLARTKFVYADMLTLRGSFLINRLNSFEAGRESFEAAVQAHPGEPQYRINLVKLLMAMGRETEAREQFARLKAMNVFGQYPDRIKALERELALTL
ncbi:MAG TPA: hypothetical protein VGA00_07965 [Acidiferrobacterales bacterium]|jgi:hypothetical protein